MFKYKPQCRLIISINDREKDAKIIIKKKIVPSFGYGLETGDFEYRNFQLYAWHQTSSVILKTANTFNTTFV